LIIVEKDYDGSRSIKYVHDQIRKLLLGQIEISKLIISKNLSKSFEHYENSGTKQPHVELAKRIAARTHMTGEMVYYTGDRVPFVMLAGHKNSKSSDCSEDPLYALTNRKPLDFKYYIENQMMKPLMRLMIPILAPHESMKKRNKKGDKVYLNDTEMRNLTTFKILFTGHHMMVKIHKTVEGGSDIMKFVKKESGCINCGARLRIKRGRNGEIVESSFCDECEERKAINFIKMQAEMRYLEEKRWACWSTCQSCVKQHLQKISCRNKDCDNFYEREKIVLDIEDLEKKMNRIKI
jgi:DNA polymerase delta subunit 1